MFNFIIKKKLFKEFRKLEIYSGDKRKENKYNLFGYVDFAKLIAIE